MSIWTKLWLWTEHILKHKREGEKSVVALKFPEEPVGIQCYKLSSQSTPGQCCFKWLHQTVAYTLYKLSIRVQIAVAYDYISVYILPLSTLCELFSSPRLPRGWKWMMCPTLGDDRFFFQKSHDALLLFVRHLTFCLEYYVDIYVLWIIG